MSLILDAKSDRRIEHSIHSRGQLLMDLVYHHVVWLHRSLSCITLYYSPLIKGSRWVPGGGCKEPRKLGLSRF